MSDDIVAKRGDVDQLYARELGEKAKGHRLISHDIMSPLVDNLQRLGLYKGNDDGVFGPKLEEAVKEFQTKVGLKPTGVVDEKTFVTISDLSDAVRDAAIHGASDMTLLQKTSVTPSGIPEMRQLAAEDLKSEMQRVHDTLGHDVSLSKFPKFNFSDQPDAHPNSSYIADETPRVSLPPALRSGPDKR